MVAVHVRLCLYSRADDFLDDSELVDVPDHGGDHVHARRSCV